MTLPTKTPDQIATTVPSSSSGHPWLASVSAGEPTPSNSGLSAPSIGIGASSNPATSIDRVSVSTQTEETQKDSTEAQASAHAPPLSREFGPPPVWYDGTEPFDYTAFDSGADPVSAKPDVDFETLGTFLRRTLDKTRPIVTNESPSASVVCLEAYPAHDKALAFHYLRLCAERGLYDLPARRSHGSGHILYPEDVDRLVTCGYVQLSEIDFAVGAAMLGVGALRRAKREATGRDGAEVRWTLSSTERPPTVRKILRYIKRQERARTAQQVRLKAGAYIIYPTERPALDQEWVKRRVEEYGWYGLKVKKWNGESIDDEIALDLIKRRDTTFYAPPEVNTPSIPPSLPHAATDTSQGGDREQAAGSDKGPSTSYSSPSEASSEHSHEQEQNGSEVTRSTGTPTQPDTHDLPDILTSAAAHSGRSLRSSSSRGRQQESAPARPTTSGPSTSAPQRRRAGRRRRRAIRFAPRRAADPGDISLTSFEEELPGWYLGAKEALEQEEEEEAEAEAASSDGDNTVQEQASVVVSTAENVSNGSGDGSSLEPGPSPSSDGGKGKRKRGEEEDTHGSNEAGQGPDDWPPSPPLKRKRVSPILQPGSESSSTIPHLIQMPPPPPSTPSDKRKGKGKERTGDTDSGSRYTDKEEEQGNTQLCSPPEKRRSMPSSSITLGSSSSSAPPSASDPVPAIPNDELNPQSTAPTLRRSRRIVAKRATARR